MPVLTIAVRERVALVTLNRPEKRNALTAQLIKQLWETFSELEGRPDVDVIVLTGADPAFCAGVDLGELEETGEVPAESAPLPPVAKPVIGAINGAAVTGGLELALMCDVLVASDRARFGDTHARFGLVPAWGQTVRLPRAIGVRRATELLLSCRLIDADEALRIGLVNHVVAHEQLLERTLALAGELVAAHQEAARTTLGLLRRSDDQLLGQALTHEREVAHAWQGDGIDTDTLLKRSGATLAANRRALHGERR